MIQRYPKNDDITIGAEPEWRAESIVQTLYDIMSLHYIIVI